MASLRFIYSGMDTVTSATSNRTEGMSPAATRAFAVFEQGVRHSYGDDLLKLVLFGSRARGDAHKESDLDIAVILKSISNRSTDRKRLADIAYEAIVETYLDVQALPVSLDEWEHPEHHSNPALIRVIKRDGNVIEAGHDPRVTEQGFSVR